MRTCTPPSSIVAVQDERPTGSRRIDERVAERAAEQERRRREAVSNFKKLKKIKSNLLIFCRCQDL